MNYLGQSCGGGGGGDISVTAPVTIVETSPKLSDVVFTKRFSCGALYAEPFVQNSNADSELLYSDIYGDKYYAFASVVGHDTTGAADHVESANNWWIWHTEQEIKIKEISMYVSKKVMNSISNNGTCKIWGQLVKFDKQTSLWGPSGSQSQQLKWTHTRPSNNPEAVYLNTTSPPFEWKFQPRKSNQTEDQNHILGSTQTWHDTVIPNDTNLGLIVHFQRSNETVNYAWIYPGIPIEFEVKYTLTLS